MLQETLRALVEARGAAVVDDPDEFRAALDDFLAEDEATLGELNLLVDAVRLGGVRRLLEVLDHGAAPGAAVEDVGAALARDRGTDDPARARWAVAVLGYALGRVGADAVPVPGGPPAAAQPPPPPPAPQEAPPPDAAPGPSGLVTSPQAPTLPEAAPADPAVLSPPTTALAAAAPGRLGPPQGYAGRPAPGPGEQGHRRGAVRGVVLAVVLALVAGAAVAGVVWWSTRDDGPTSGKVDNPTDTATGGDGEGATLPDSEMVVSFVAPAGDERVYRLDPASGAVEALTAGPNHQLPNVSPDRRSVVFLDVTEQGRVPYVLDLGDRSTTPLLDPDGPCRFSGRPAWNHDGTRIALVCESADRSRRDLYVAPWGRLPLRLTWLARDDLARETPTWVSDDEFVYVRHDGRPGNATGLWRQRAEAGSAPTRLTPDDGSYLSHPAWSPQRGLLLYMVHEARGALGRLWVMKADGTDPQELAGRRVLHPAWSPDGDQLVFALDSADGPRLLVASDWRRPDRAEEVVPEGDPGYVGVPAWSSR